MIKCAFYGFMIDLYGKEGEYNSLAGKDSSRALALSSFKEEDLNYDLVITSTYSYLFLFTKIMTEEFMRTKLILIHFF